MWKVCALVAMVKPEEKRTELVGALAMWEEAIREVSSMGFKVMRTGHLLH